MSMWRRTFPLAAASSSSQASHAMQRQADQQQHPPTDQQQHPPTGWDAEVAALGDRMLIAFGPFLVRRGDVAGSPPPRRPLADLDRVLDAARKSRPMAERLRTSDASFGSVVWASRMLGATISERQAAMAAAVARRHGIVEPLHLSAGSRGGHAWASDVAWLDAYGRGDRPAAIGPSVVLLGDEVVVHRMHRRRRRDLVAQEHEGGGPPKKPRKLPAAVRMAVWNRWIGYEMGVGACYCCGRKVAQQDFECGHVIASSRGGAGTVDNLRVLCRTCNRSMGAGDLYEFRRTFR